MIREFTAEQLEELLDDAQEIDSRPWRHGRKVRLVFEHDGAHWAIWVDSHHEEGLQIDHSIMATAVQRMEKTVWVWGPT